MAREVIKVIRKEQGKHLITYVLLDDGTEASVYGEAKVGDKMMVYFHEQWNMIKAERIKHGGDEGAARETSATKADQESR
ncbi:MAG TPA: hypothetical protein PKV66_00560 [Candidatus Pelethenecus sp.]|nr:hypothetical protein [Candidatus Pelethenecus sp.]